MIAAIVLTAGKSERMGGRPKALLEFKGRTFLEHVLAAIGSAGITNIAVVVGHHRDEITSALSLAFCCVQSGLRTGNEYVRSGRDKGSTLRECQGAGIFLVDQPLIDAETIIAAFDSAEAGTDRSSVL